MLADCARGEEEALRHLGIGHPLRDEAEDLDLTGGEPSGVSGCSGRGSELGVQLKFSKMDDFEPGNVVQQVEPLRKLLETRNKLKELQAKMETSEELEEELEKILKSSEGLDKLAGELGASPQGNGGDGKPAA